VPIRVSDFLRQTPIILGMTVSRAMLSRYSHVRMEAKRRALDEIATRQRAADEKREVEAKERREHGAGGSSISGDSLILGARTHCSVAILTCLRRHRSSP
jgi:hypothetical protein